MPLPPGDTDFMAQALKIKKGWKNMRKLLCLVLAMAMFAMLFGAFAEEEAPKYDLQGMTVKVRLWDSPNPYAEDTDPVDVEKWLPVYEAAKAKYNCGSPNHFLNVHNIPFAPKAFYCSPASKISPKTSFISPQNRSFVDFLSMKASHTSLSATKSTLKKVFYTKCKILFTKRTSSARAYPKFAFSGDFQHFGTIFACRW